MTDIEELVAELDGAEDRDHPDVAVAHASGWTLSAFANGLLIWENAESDAAPRHRRSVSRRELIALLSAFAEGDVESVERCAWEPGYGP